MNDFDYICISIRDDDGYYHSVEIDKDLLELKYKDGYACITIKEKENFCIIDYLGNEKLDYNKLKTLLNGKVKEIFYVYKKSELNIIAFELCFNYDNENVKVSIYDKYINIEFNRIYEYSLLSSTFFDKYASLSESVEFFMNKCRDYYDRYEILEINKHFKDIVSIIKGEGK